MRPFGGKREGMIVVGRRPTMEKSSRNPLKISLQHSGAAMSDNPATLQQQHLRPAFGCRRLKLCTIAETPLHQLCNWRCNTNSIQSSVTECFFFN
jgi:hypothetical protein